MKKKCTRCKKTKLKNLDFVLHGKNYGDGYLPRCKKCIYERKSELNAIKKNPSPKSLRFINDSGIYL